MKALNIKRIDGGSDMHHMIRLGRFKGNHFRPSLDLFDIGIISLILLKEFILDFFGLGNIVNGLICALIILRIISEHWRSPLVLALSLLVTPLLMLVSVFMGGSISIGLKNALRIAQLQVYLLYVAYLFIQKREGIIEAYEQAGVLLNAILVINMVVMVIQYIFPGSIQAVSDGNVISFEDNISGLFGYASTHAVAFYTVFIIIYNINWSQRVVDRSRIIVVFYTIILAILSIIIGTLNDNKALFFFIIIALFICCVYIGAFHLRKAVKIAAILIPSIIVVCLSAYELIPVFKAFIDKLIWSISFVVIRALSPDSIVNGSDERFKMIVYALLLSKSWQFGEGIGAFDMYQPGALGFNHFGQSDYGSIIILCGVWAYLALVVSYVYTLTRVSGADGRRAILVSIPIVLFVTMSTIYVQVFSQVRIGIPFLMLGISLALTYAQQNIRVR